MVMLAWWSNLLIPAVCFILFIHLVRIWILSIGRWILCFVNLLSFIWIHSFVCYNSRQHNNHGNIIVYSGCSNSWPQRSELEWILERQVETSEKYFLATLLYSFFSLTRNTGRYISLDTVLETPVFLTFRYPLLFFSHSLSRFFFILWILLFLFFLFFL